MKNEFFKLRLLICVTAIAWGSLAPAAVGAANTAEALYQDAMIQETGERDPEKALTLYREVVKLAGSDTVLASKARLRMAACEERLGRTEEAEALYLQVVTATAATPGEVSELAKTSLDRLQARKAEEAAKARATKMVRRFEETRYAVSAGPGWGRSGNSSVGDVTLALRYRLSSSSRPLAVYFEGGGVLPLGSSRFPDQVQPYNAQTTDTASLKLKYQIYFAGIAELPHGKQKSVIPELGIGMAMTASDIQYTSGNTGSQNQSLWSPYLGGGLHLYADRRVSLLIQGNYIANPYPKSVAIDSPAHNQTFNFPTSIWSLGVRVQVKIGWTKIQVGSPE